MLGILLQLTRKKVSGDKTSSINTGYFCLLERFFRRIPGFDSKCFNTKNNCYIKSNSKQIITQTTFIIKHDFLLNFKLLNKFCGWPIFKAKKCHSWHFLTLTQLSPRLMVCIYTESKLIDNWLRCRFFF